MKDLMLGAVRLLVATVLFLMGLSATNADTFYDSLQATTINPNLRASAFPQFSIAPTISGVVFSKPVGIEHGAAWLTTCFAATGDFTATVVADRANLGNAALGLGCYAFTSGYPAAQDVAVNPAAYSSGWADTFFARPNFAASNIWTSEGMPSVAVLEEAQSGLLRLRRTGNTLIADYSTDGVNFTLRNALSSPFFEGPTTFSLLLTQEYGSTDFNEGLFRDFSITADGLIPVPEPSALVLLGIGAIGLLAYMWRRRGRMMRIHIATVSLLSGMMALIACRSADAEVLLYDAFNSGAATGWTEYDGSFAVVGGAYQITSNNGDWSNNNDARATVGSTSWSDYRVDFDYKIINTGSSGWPTAFLFRVQDMASGTDNEHAYQFQLGPNVLGFAKIYGTWTERTILEEVNVSLALETWHHFRLDISGTTGAAFVDGNHIMTYDGFTDYPTGAIALKSINGGSALFDNVLVQSIPEPSTLVLLGVGAIGVLFHVRRRRRTLVSCVIAGFSIVLATSAAQADVFNMGTGFTSLEMVPVGNPGNAGEWSGQSYSGYGTDRVCGEVDYVYNIGKFEVTAGQYTAFLNAVAKTDTYGLYNTSMWSGTYGCKIQQSGSAGSYAYSVASDYANRPVNYVSWGDAARFANWLHNGQPTGTQSLSTTEDGAYYLNGATTNAALQAVGREADWKWAITSEDEWYKAAYYKGGGTNTGYWNYPTSSDTVPGRDMADASGNNANYYEVSPYPIDSPYYTTQVGEFQMSDSPYGTFDQGGNIWEWTEALLYSSYRGLRGGSFSDVSDHLLASNRNDYNPTFEYRSVGFRVASVPEPGSLTLFVAAAGGLLIWRLRRNG